MLGYYENDDAIFSPMGENSEFRDAWGGHVDYLERLEEIECDFECLEVK